MNYRHAYHAGNFADVLKHAILALIIEHLKKKEAAFRVIDTHAGIGLYDLTELPSLKTQEWRAGIGLVCKSSLTSQSTNLLHPYLSVIQAHNPESALTFYPGSPILSYELLRPQDRLILNELHPEDFKTLEHLFKRKRRAKVLNLDAWIALKALLPPKEKRGVILIDPPFEEMEEYDKLVKGLAHATRRFPSGTYVIWYPIKDLRTVDQFYSKIGRLGLKDILVAEMRIGSIYEDKSLKACGQIIINPPFMLEKQLQTLLPEVCHLLAKKSKGSFVLEAKLPFKRFSQNI